MSRMEVCPTAISDGVDLSEGHKSYLKEWCLMNSQTIFMFLNYF